MRPVLLSLAIVLGSQATTAAQSVPFTYVREAGAEACADEARIMRRVARLLARHGESSSAARRVRGNVAAEDAGYVATLSLEENGAYVGVRVLRAARCEALFEQIVFVAYLLLSSPSPEVDGASTSMGTDENGPMVDGLSTDVPERDAAAPAQDAMSPPEAELAPREPEIDTANLPEDDERPPILRRDDAPEDAPATARARARFPFTRPFYVHAGGAATYGLVPGFWPGITTGFGYARTRFAFESNFGIVAAHDQALTLDATVRRSVFAVETLTCAQTKRRARVRFAACLALGFWTTFATLVEANSGGDITVSPYAGPTLAVNVALTSRLSVSVSAGTPFRLVLHGQTLRDGDGTQHVLRDDLVTTTLGISARAEFGTPR